MKIIFLNVEKHIYFCILKDIFSKTFVICPGLETKKTVPYKG